MLQWNTLFGSAENLSPVGGNAVGRLQEHALDHLSLSIVLVS